MIPWTCCVILVFLIVGASAFNSGRPHCRQPDDFQRDWGVKNNPKMFWRCTGFATSELRDCDEGRTFNDVYLMCTIPGAIIGDIDRPPTLIECDDDEEIDLSGSDPFCVHVPCEGGLVVYNPEGHPQCHRETPISQIQWCQGAPREMQIPGDESCEIPDCDTEEYHSNRLFPSADPNEFYRCAHVNTPVAFKCHPALCFDDKSQACVWPAAWSNVCA